jgi:hypothetical protein
VVVDYVKVLHSCACLERLAKTMKTSVNMSVFGLPHEIRTRDIWNKNKACKPLSVSEYYPYYSHKPVEP